MTKTAQPRPPKTKLTTQNRLFVTAEIEATAIAILEHYHGALKHFVL